MTMMRLPHAALGGVTIGASMRPRYRLSTRVPAGGARGADSAAAAKGFREPVARRGMRALDVRGTATGILNKCTRTPPRLLSWVGRLRSARPSVFGVEVVTSH
jgi:hypothetical protein